MHRNRSDPMSSTRGSQTSGAPAGDYVSAELATQLASTLSKLTWTMLYGKSHDAASLAVAAEQMLTELKVAQKKATAVA